MQELFSTPPSGAARPPAPAAIAQPIAPDWHPLFGARLAVFPRNVQYAGEPSSGSPARAGYWPDLATLVEDEHTRQLMYYPCGPSPYSLLVVFGKPACTWQTFKFKDAELVGYSQGESFEQAMANAMLLGPQPDEG